MSDYLTPALYHGRALELQLKNTIWNCHDLICGCNNTQQHLLHIIEEKPCRHSEDAGTDSTAQKEGGEKINMDFGDLETVFAETDEQIG